MLIEDYGLALGKSFLFALATLLPILNPTATAPIFLSLTEGASAAVREVLAARIARNVFLLLFAAMLTGSVVLDFFGISLAIVRVGGGCWWWPAPGACSTPATAGPSVRPAWPRVSRPKWPIAGPSIP